MSPGAPWRRKGMELVRSADGTELALERAGAGSPLVVVAGGFGDRRWFADLDELVAPHLSVGRYDRRGRGDSGDAAAYAVDREIEDLAAVLDAVGGDAFVYGHSSGAALAILGAASGLPIRRLVVSEPPYRIDGGGHAHLRDEVAAAVAAGDRATGVKAVLRIAIEVPDDVVATAEEWPDWPEMLAIAHTLPYDLAIVGDGTIPAAVRDIAAPTLVLHGSESFPWLGAGMRALAAAIPGASSKELVGQDHGLGPEAVAPEVLAFFA